MRGREIQHNEVHVWSLGLQRTAQDVAELAALLSTDERDRAARYGLDRVRTEFVVARGLLRRLLGGCCATDPRRLRFAYGPAGKPHLCDPPGPHFNVSHSGEVVLIALSGGGPVGVDVERVRRLETRDLMSRVLSPWERAVLEGLPLDQRDAAFFKAWTCKEAFVKADGAGLAYGLDRVEVALAPTEPARLVRLDGSTEAARAWSLWSLEPAPGYLGALAVAGQDCRLVLRSDCAESEERR
jgi:4'-phosphopantetheinyl transferase